MEGHIHRSMMGGLLYPLFHIPFLYLSCLQVYKGLSLIIVKHESRFSEILQRSSRLQAASNVENSSGMMT